MLDVSEILIDLAFNILLKLLSKVSIDKLMELFSVYTDSFKLLIFCKFLFNEVLGIKLRPLPLLLVLSTEWRSLIYVPDLWSFGPPRN